MKALEILRHYKQVTAFMPQGTYAKRMVETTKEAIAELKQLKNELENLKHIIEMQTILIDDYKKTLKIPQNKITRVEIISKLGRDCVYKCDDSKHYELSFQDDNRTLKLFVTKNKE